MFTSLISFKGLGIGTVVVAFTIGKAIDLVGRWLDKKFDFFFYEEIISPHRGG